MPSSGSTTTSSVRASRTTKSRATDAFCKKPITEPRKAGEIWVDGEGIAAVQQPACTLGAYAELKAKGKKINVAYVFDTERGIKLFADQAFYSVEDGKGEIDAVPAEEGRRGARRQDRRQGGRASPRR